MASHGDQIYYIKDLCNSIFKSINLEYKKGELLVLNIGDEMK